MGKYINIEATATLAGCGLLAAGTSLTVSHLIEGGQPLGSPMVGAVVALTVGSAVAVRAGMHAWMGKRRLVAFIAFTAVIFGEMFGLFNGAERLLVARQERVRIVTADNAPYAIAQSRVYQAEAAYSDAQVAVRAEAAEGGCGRACRALKDEAANAHVELQRARIELETVEQPKSTNVLADVSGLPSAWIEIAPALMFTLALNGLGFALLAIGHGSNPASVQDTRKPPPASMTETGPKLATEEHGKETPISEDPQVYGLVPRLTRAEQVAAFCRQFRSDQGREPTFTEVRKGTQLPASTVSKYRRAALA